MKRRSRKHTLGQHGCSDHNALSNQRQKSRNPLGSALAGLGLIALSSTAYGQDRYWNGYTDSLWSAANWSTTVAGLDQVVIGPAANVAFSVTPTPLNQNTILDMDLTISSLTVNDLTPVTIGGTNLLTISATGLITGININSGAGLTTINSNLELGALSEIVTVNNVDGLVINGVVSGINGLTKAGAGVLTLTGVETYTGATVVSDGTLQIGDGVTVGTSIASTDSVLVAPDGILAINLANTETFGESVTNNGQIHWIADGTNYQASTSVFSGAGSMLVTAPGTTVLLGDNTFSGGTTIDTLGDVLVGNLLNTSSSPFGSGVLTINSGTIDTYQSQLLTIEVGGYDQTGGEIGMHLEGTALGEYTQYDVAGTATLSGGTVFVYDRSGNYVPVGGDEQNIISTSGGLTGEFASNSPQSEFYNSAAGQTFFYQEGQTLLYPTITYDPNNAYVTWVQDSYSSIPGLTQNQNAVGGGIEAFAFENPVLAADLTAYLNSQNIALLPGMYELLAPEELTAIYQMGFAAAEIQNANIQRHLARVRQGSGGQHQETQTSTDSKGGMVKENVMVDDSNRWSFFMEGTGGSASVDSSANASGYDFDTAGGSMGADVRVNEHFNIGLMGSYGKSDADLVNNGSIDAESFKAAIYATMYQDGFYVDALLGAGYNSYDTRRTALLGVAEGEANAWEANAMLNTGYDIRKGNWTFGPTASVSYTRLMLDDFSETGSLAPLSYPSQHQESLRGELGAKVAYNMNLNGVVITPQVRIAWQREFMDSTQSMEAGFGGGGSTFSVDGPEMDRDRIVLGAGLTAQLNPTFSVYAFYDGQVDDSNYQAEQVTVGLKLDF